MNSDPLEAASFQDTHDCLQQLLLRSATDLDFRRRLLNAPQATIEEHLGWPLVARLNIRFIENEADVTIVLPDYQGDELTEEEQEAVCAGNGAAVHAAGLLKLRAWLTPHIK